MKKIILSFGILGMLVGFSVDVSAQAQGVKTPPKPVVKTKSKPVVKKNAPIIKLDKTVNDYGKIKQNSNGSCYFTITNTGQAPLKITNARGSCGCTVPDWPREPIAPGDSAKMKVTYATNRLGAFSKTVTITSNASNGTNKTVRIKGTVLKPAPAAPANNGAPVNKKAKPMLKS